MKLADFGLSKQTESKCYVTGLKGTLPWMAPELFQANHEEDEIEIPQKSDVFSCGCVFFVYLTRENGGIHPFGDIIDHLQIYANIQKGDSINIHSKFNNSLMLKQHFLTERISFLGEHVNHPKETELIQKMIERDPIKRVTSEYVKNQAKDMLLKGNSAIQISFSNQDETAFPPENQTADYRKPGAKSIYEIYLENRDLMETSRCDFDSLSTLFFSVHGNDQQLATQQRSYPTPEKLPRYNQRYNLRCNSNRIANNNNNSKSPDYHPKLNSASETHTEVTVNANKRRESEWKLNYFDSQKRSCDSNNNRRTPKKKLFAIKQCKVLN